MGQQDVMQVISLNEDNESIDVSKRNIHKEEATIAKEEFEKSKMVHLIMN